jgi:outer membrane protein TolC
MQRCFIFLFLFLTGCQFKSANFNPVSKTAPSYQKEWDYTPQKTERFDEDIVQVFDPKNPPTLTELINIALNNNPSTKLAWQQALEQAMQLAISRSSYYPTATLNGNYTRLRNAAFPNETGSFYETQYGPTLSLSYTLFDFGVRKYQSRVQEKILVAMNLSHNESIQALIQLVKDDYFNVIYNQELLTAKEEDLNDALANFEIAQSKYKVGVASFLDFVQTKAQYITTQGNLEDQKTNLEASFYKLAFDMGLPNQALFKFSGFEKQINSSYTLQEVNLLVGIANNLRPDVQSYIAQVKAKEALVKQKRRERYPKLLGSFLIGKTWYDDGVHDKYHFTAQVNLNISLFEGFALKNAERLAKKELAIAKTELEAIKKQVTNEILTLKSALQNAAKQLEYAQDILKTQRIVLDIALSKYKNGTTSILELITAQNNLAQARAQLALAKKNWYTHLTDLAKAVGVLTNELNTTAPLFKIGEK